MPITLDPAHLYPLADPKQFDNDLGTGYSYAWFYLEEPVTGMYICDAFIVNERGVPHPGYDQSPVPIHINDLTYKNDKPVMIDAPDTDRPERAPWMGWAG